MLACRIWSNYIKNIMRKTTVNWRLAIWHRQWSNQLVDCTKNNKCWQYDTSSGPIKCLTVTWEGVPYLIKLFPKHSFPKHFPKTWALSFPKLCKSRFWRISLHSLSVGSPAPKGQYETADQDSWGWKCLMFVKQDLHLSKTKWTLSRLWWW